jgi:hypothetical protein
MAKTQSTWPTTIDSTLQTDRLSGDTITSDSYDIIEDAVFELETKVGVNNSAVTSTIDYQLKNLLSATNVHSTTVTATTVSAATFSGGSVTGLPGLLADDQHVLDSEVIAALAGLSSVRVHLSADQSIPNETFQKVALNTEDFDTLNEFDPVTNYRFTATKAGYYQVNASTFFYSTPAAGKYYDILIFKNGGSFARGRQVSPSTEGLTANASAVINLAVGDYIELYVYHNTGVAVLLYCDSSLTQMSIHRLS